MKDRCWKRRKDGKVSFDANNYLKVLFDDEEATLEQLNHLCGTKHYIFLGAKIPRIHLPTNAIEDETIDDREVIPME
jgi:hypothetical protein